MKPGALTLAILILLTPALWAEELNMLYMAQAGYQPSDILERASSFEEQTGITVNLWFVEYEDQYNLIDPIPAHLVETVRQGIIPEIYSAFSYDAHIWAVPFLANFQLFYTNMELLHQAGFLHPPSTLEELVDMATRAKQMGLIEYPLFDSLRKQEVLVCEFVWLVGAFGGIWWTRPEGSTSTRKRAGTPSSSWSACWTKNF